ncbi:MAG: hypothetical protein ABI615_02995 [Chthoniobacterales bacterium]
MQSLEDSYLGIIFLALLKICGMAFAFLSLALCASQSNCILIL